MDVTPRMDQSQPAERAFRLVEGPPNQPQRHRHAATFAVGPWHVTVELGVANRRYEPLGFIVRDPNGDPEREPVALTSREIRRIPFGKLAEAARVHLKAELQMTLQEHPEFFRDESDRGRASFEGSAAAQGIRTLETPRAGRPRLSRGELERAAGIYNEADLSGSKQPTQDLADQLSMSRSTAGKWVQRARALGLIPSVAKPGSGKPRGIDD